MKTLSIIIPVYNEQKTLAELVNKVLKVKFPKDFAKEIIIVNDGSKDSSGEIIDRLAKNNAEVIALHNSKNLGKSQTVKNGIIESNGEYLIIQDADFEYEPNEIINLLDLMLNKDLDVVYGNRFGKRNKVIYPINYIGNKFISLISNIFTYPRIKIWIPDMEVCYKLIKGDIAREIGQTIESKSNFGFEPEITAKLSKYKKQNGSHLKFGIVPITYNARTIEEGKKMKAFKDGFKALIEILRFNLF